MSRRKGQIWRDAFSLEYELDHPILDPILVNGNIYKHDDGSVGIGIEHVYLNRVDITRSVDLDAIQLMIREDIQ